MKFFSQNKLETTCKIRADHIDQIKIFKVHFFFNRLGRPT